MDGSISSPLRRKYSGPIRLRATTTEIPTFHLERGRDRVGGQHQKRDEGLDGLLGWRAGESREKERMAKMANERIEQLGGILGPVGTNSAGLALTRQQQFVM